MFGLKTMSIYFLLDRDDVSYQRIQKMCYFLFTVLICIISSIVFSAQSSLARCNPMDSRPGSSVHRISQARILEQVAIFYFTDCSQSRDRMCVFYVPNIGRQILYRCATWQAKSSGKCTRLIYSEYLSGSSPF